jgi:hypothetical protein
MIRVDRRRHAHTMKYAMKRYLAHGILLISAAAGVGWFIFGESYPYKNPGAARTTFVQAMKNEECVPRTTTKYAHYSRRGGRGFEPYISATGILNYCGCRAERIADTFTDKDIKHLGVGNIPADLLKKLEGLEKACFSWAMSMDGA